MYNIFCFYSCRVFFFAFLPANKIFTRHRHCSAKYMRLITNESSEHTGKKNYMDICSFIHSFIRLIHVFHIYIHIADTFGFRSLMPDKIQRYSLHFRHWGNEKKLRMSERDCESKWKGLLVWIHHSHLMPHSFFGIEITNFVCWEIKCSMLCRQCQLNQQHAVWFYFQFFSLALSHFRCCILCVWYGLVFMGVLFIANLFLWN